jgi:hypothetical protein
MILYLLITDEKRVLFIKETSGALILPNSKNHWPITKSRPRNNWPSSLSKHVTYGLFPSIEYERHRPFGFPVGTSLIIFKMNDSDLEQLFYQISAVRRWSKYNSSLESFGFKHRLLNLEDINLDLIDLQSAHGLRFLFPKFNFGRPKSDALGTLTNDA